MNSTTFHLHERADIKDRRADMSKRNADGYVIPSDTRWYNDQYPDDQGGSGVYSSAIDFMKLLGSLVENDGRILHPSSLDKLFRPCLPPLAAEKFQTLRAAIYQQNDRHEMALPSPVKVNYALGGMTTVEDIPGGRKAGSMSWGGLPNLSWVVDRSAGIALLYASQLLPPGDTVSQKMVRKFEAAVYSNEFFNGASQI